MLFVIIDSLGKTAVSLFVSSNRLRNFIKTLPVLDTPFKIMFGLGVKSPGSFSIYDAVDNYYLYVLLTMGVVGLIVIGTCLFIIGHNLHKLIFQRQGNVYMMVFAIFICHMISGLSENCILYYIFPSSMIYFTMYFCLLRRNATELTELNKESG